MSFILQND